MLTGLVYETSFLTFTGKTTASPRVMPLSLLNIQLRLLLQEWRLIYPSLSSLSLRPILGSIIPALRPFMQGMPHIGHGKTLLPPTHIQLSYPPEIIANMLFVRRSIPLFKINVTNSHLLTLIDLSGP